MVTGDKFLLPSSFFPLPSSFFLLPSSLFLRPSSFFLLPSSFFPSYLVFLMILSRVWPSGSSIKTRSPALTPSKT
ncbi:MAG: hypothetical protein ACRCT1_12435 [Microcoleaceae cyanobacterium]